MSLSLTLWLWLLIGSCVLASVTIGLGVGIALGRWYTLANEPRRLKADRRQLVSTLTNLLQSTSVLNEESTRHGSAQTVTQPESCNVSPTADLQSLQKRLLRRVNQMAASNRKLESELVVSLYRMKQQALQLNQTKKEARTDSLCSLGNRKAYDEAVSYFQSRMISASTPYALMLIDVDHFKKINDRFGHSAGDQVLTQISRSLIESVRPNDLVFRIGGDEFAILLDGVNTNSASPVGERIRDDLERRDFRVGSQSDTAMVSLSIGLTTATSRDTVESIFVRADKALYQSKEGGRNRLTIATDHKTPAPATECTERGKPAPTRRACAPSIRAEIAR